MAFNPTPEQELVLEHDPGRHARVLAGPGTGKSATVVAYIEKLLSAESPPRLKLLTFTRAATGELAQKVAEHPAAATMRPSTIHSFAISVLLRNPGAGAFPDPLRLADDWEQSNAVNPDLARRVGVTKTFLERKLLPEMASGWESLNDVLFARVSAEQRARFLTQWHEHRSIFGYTLLSELPFRLREALQNHPELRGADYDLLIVDEYQDLNACDLEVLKLVAARGCRIIGTGDDDQSIFGFRWADPEGIRRFAQDYENAIDYPLSLTQRCGKRIVEWANYVIQGDPDRPEGRALRCVENAADGEVALLSFANQNSEARGVAELVNRLIHTEAIEPSKILVLLRTDHNGQFSRPIRQHLSDLHIESFDPEAVRLMLDEPTNRRLVEILRLVSNREDSVAWASLLVLTQGIGRTCIDYVYNRAHASQQQFGKALLQAGEEGFPGLNRAIATRVSDLIGAVSNWLEERPLPEQRPVGGWGNWIRDIAGGNVAPAPTEDFSDLLLRLDGLVEETQGLAGYVSQIGPLGKDLMQTECDGVRIMRMATSKGLTVDATIIVGVEDGLIPRPDEALSEERRLLYVAMTRARKYLYGTWARTRYGPTARAGEARGGMRQISNLLLGGPVASQDGVAFLRG